MNSSFNLNKYLKMSRTLILKKLNIGTQLTDKPGTCPDMCEKNSDNLLLFFYELRSWILDNHPLLDDD